MFCPSCGNENHDTATFCIFCGSRMIDGTSPVLQKSAGASKKPLPSPKPAEERTSLNGDRYHIERELGAGGMGRVLLAQDTKMKGIVVIKEMHHFLARGENKEYLEKRFVTEAQLLFNLKHPGLPKVLDYFVEEANMYLVMEYVKGKDLAKLIEEHPSHRIDVKIGLKWMRKVLELLRYLHNQNPPIIHRDIKPSNLMLTPEGEIFMLDFGIARTISAESASHTSVGTFGYASPEQFSGRAVQASDIFSTGATFHHLLSGEAPAERDPFDFPDLSGYRDDVPPALNELISRMVNKRKEERPQTVEEVLSALNQIRETNVMPPVPGPDIVNSSGSGSLQGAPTNRMSEVVQSVPVQPQASPRQGGTGGIQAPPAQSVMRPPSGTGSASLGQPVPARQNPPGSGSFSQPPAQGGTGGIQAPPRQGGTGGIPFPPPPPQMGSGGLPFPPPPPPPPPMGTGGIPFPPPPPPPGMFPVPPQMPQPGSTAPCYDKNIGMPPVPPGGKMPVQAQKKPASVLKTLLIIGGILLLLGGLFVAAVVWYALTHPVDNSSGKKVNITVNSDTDPGSKAKTGDTNSGTTSNALPDVNSTNDYKISAEDLKQLEQAVESGEVDSGDALLTAVLAEDKALTKKFIAKGVDVNTIKDGMTALIGAASNGKTEMVDVLLANGADPNIKGMHGWTALHYAVTLNNTKMVKSLMASGANPDIASDDGSTPRSLSAIHNNQELNNAIGK